MLRSFVCRDNEIETNFVLLKRSYLSIVLVVGFYNLVDLVVEGKAPIAPVRFKLVLLSCTLCHCSIMTISCAFKLLRIKRETKAVK